MVRMKRVLSMMVLAMASGLATFPSERIWPRKRKPAQDSSASFVRMQEGKESRKMAISIYPVQIQVTMNAIQIHSEHSQMLPIYTHSGNFYMAVRLKKGVNWINGLPRGHYFINNRPITIN